MSKDMKLIMENFRQHVKEQDEAVEEAIQGDPDFNKTTEECIVDYMQGHDIPTRLAKGMPLKALARAVEEYYALIDDGSIGQSLCNNVAMVLDKFKGALMRGLEAATAAIMTAAARASIRFEEGQQNLQTERLVPAGRYLDDIKAMAQNLEDEMERAQEMANLFRTDIPGAAQVMENWETFHASLRKIEIP